MIMYDDKKVILDSQIVSFTADDEMMGDVRGELGAVGKYQGSFRYNFNIEGQEFYVHEVDSRTISELVRSGARDLTERHLHITSPLELSGRAVEIVNSILSYSGIVNIEVLQSG